MPDPRRPLPALRAEHVPNLVTQEFANFIKNHHVLQRYWKKCLNELEDEKREPRGPETTSDTSIAFVSNWRL